MLSMKLNNPLRSSRNRGRNFMTRVITLIVAAAFASICAFAQAPTNTAQELSDNKVEVRDDEKRPAPAPASKSIAQTPGQRKIGGVTFSGSLRLRVENHGWFETPGFEDDYTLGAAVLRLSLGQQKERYDWQIEGQFPVL